MCLQSSVGKWSALLVTQGSFHVRGLGWDHWDGFEWSLILQPNSQDSSHDKGKGPGEQAKAEKSPESLTSELSHHPFCHILLSKQVTSPARDPRGGKIGSPFHERGWVGESCSVASYSLRPHGLCNPWTSPGQNTGVGSLFLLQGISPTQGSNPGLPHCKQTLYCVSHQGSLLANQNYKYSVKPLEK